MYLLFRLFIKFPRLYVLTKYRTAILLDQIYVWVPWKLGLGTSVKGSACIVSVSINYIRYIYEKILKCSLQCNITKSILFPIGTHSRITNSANLISHKNKIIIQNQNNNIDYGVINWIECVVLMVSYCLWRHIFLRRDRVNAIGKSAHKMAHTNADNSKST